jgi:hypothetical protein
VETIPVCPECGATLAPGQACRDYFDMMLFWENENPSFDVHHLMVLSYYLQHPTLYSPEGLRQAVHLLGEFLEWGVTPEQVRKRERTRRDSGRKKWKIKGSPASFGSYPNPVHWQMTAVDVTAGGVEHYIEKVREWAKQVRWDIRDAGNFLSGRADST